MIIEDQLDEMTKENGISLWDINVIHYSAAITILEQQGKLKENRSFDQRNNKPGCQVQLEQKIEAIRKRLAFIDVILKCKQEGKFTKHQRTIEQKLKKWYRKITRENLESIRAELKHELRTCTSKLKKRRTVEQRDRINKQFSLNPKNVYRKFKMDENIEIKENPTRESIKSYWEGIWGTDKEYNTQAEWLSLLEKEYCKSTQQKTYKVTLEILLEILKRAANNKAPGRDLIVMYWIKNLTSCHHHLVNIMESLLTGQTQVPQWLSLSKTNLLPKNTDTHKPENYRPIALQNNLYKVYTSILNHFLADHCRENKIISIEQAAGKKARGDVLISY